MNRNSYKVFNLWAEVILFSIIFLLGNTYFVLAQQIDDIVRLNSNPNNGNSVQFLVSFNGGTAPYSPVDVNDFSLTSTVGGSIASVSSSSANPSVTVTVNGISGNGTIRLDLNDSDISITDNLGNPLISNTYTSGEVYTIDQTAPGYISVSDLGDGSYKAGETVTLRANLGEIGLMVSADLSVIDSDFNNAQIFIDNGDNTYSFTTNNLDLANNMMEGAAVAISFTSQDAAGNSSTNNSLQLILDKTSPNLNSALEIALDNQYLDIHATEGLFTTVTGTGAMVPSDLTLIFLKNTGNASNVTISSLKKPNSTIEASAGALIGGETDIRIFLNVTGTPNGNETLRVTPASGSSVYDIAGNGMPLVESTNAISMFNQCTTIADAGTDTTICIGNTINLGGPQTASGGSGFYSYEWRIPANGTAIISTSSHPTVTPSASTIYEVTVINSDGCSATDQVTITVNPLPIVTFNPDSIIFRNDASPFRLDNNGQVSPVHTTGSGGIFSGNGVTFNSSLNQYFFNPSLANNGDNSITYSYINSNGCTASVSKNLTVVSATGAVINLLTSYCPDFNSGIVTGLQAAPGAVSPGRTFESLRLYKNGVGYVNGPLTDTNADDIYDLDLQQLTSGNFSVAVFSTFDSGNPSGAHLDQFSTSFLYEKGEEPIISNLESDYCSNADTITLEGSIPTYTNPVFSAPEGITSGNFVPGNISFGVGQYQKNIIVTYSYKDDNNCAGSVTQNVNVNRVPSAPTSTSPITYCTTDLINSLTVIGVSGASFSWYNDADTSDPGNFLDNGSTLNPVDDSGQPLDNAVSGSYPYWVTQTLNSCESPATPVTIEVYDRYTPEISEMNPQYCYDEGDIDFSVGEANGFPISAETIKIDGNIYPDSEFNTVTLGVGTHLLQYTITNANNCTDSTEFEFEITPLPIVNFSGFNPTKSYCYTDNPITLVGSPAVTPGTIGIFTSSTGGLLENNGNGTVVFSPELAALAAGGDSLTSTTSHTITYTFIDQFGCSRSRAYSFTVYPLPEVTIEGFNISKTYCYEEDSFLITGFPTNNNGRFTGNGITDHGNGTATFNPSLAASIAGVSSTTDSVTSHIISYRYTNGNGCVNTYFDTIRVNPLPDIALSGYDSTKAYCYSDEPVLLTGFPSDSNGYFTGNGIIDHGDGTATFTPLEAALAAGANSATDFMTQHTITYTYTNSFGCKNSKSVTLTVNPLPNPEIVNLPETYCKNDKSVTLKAIPTEGTFNGSGILGNIFNPAIANPGLDTITYSYADPRTGCSNSVSAYITVRPNPESNFIFETSCNEAKVIFQNTSAITVTDTLDEIANYEWNFGDFTANDFSPHPTHIFNNPDIYTVNLKSTTQYGCSSEKDTMIVVGTLPVANFEWENNVVTDTSIFTSTSTLAFGSITAFQWRLNNETISDTTEALAYQFKNPGTYAVTLQTTTNSGCTDTISKNIYIIPEVNSFPYREDFETENHGWIVEGTNASWEVAVPEGNIIDTAASGNRIFVTNAKGSYPANEQSWVNSPKFDISALNHPYLSLKIWSSTDPGFDGAVVQVSTDKGKTWQVLGSVEEGLGWYNSPFIVANPGKQTSGSIGWSRSDSDWQLAKFSLQEFLHEKDIRFRIAFGSNGDNTPGKILDGFAFDDFQIGERNRTILVEHFSNVNNTDFFRIEKDLNSFSEMHANEVLSIHYHTDFPGKDPFNKQNMADPSARALYYGIAKTPGTVMNGLFDEADIAEWLETEFRKSVLEESPFNININFGNEPKELLNIKATIMANLDLEATVNAYIAIVEEEVTNNGKKYYNVLRKMLPNAAGIELSQHVWEKGDAVEVNQSWGVENLEDTSRLRVIVFLQNKATQEVYQAAIAKPSYTPPIVTGLPEWPGQTAEKPENKPFLYPNPTDTGASVVFASSRNYSWKVLDKFGRIVLTGNVRNGNKILLNTNHLAAGLYVVHINDGQDNSYSVRLSVVH